MLELGPHKGTIVSHRTKKLGDKNAIALLCTIGDDQGEAIIFLTEKSMGMARAALKLCGFDVDKQDLVLLEIQPTLLAGREVPLLVDEYNGKTQIKVDLNQPIDKGTLGSLTKQMRAVKKKGAAADGGGEPDYGDIPF